MSQAAGSPGMRIAAIALAGTLGAMGMLGHRRGGAVELFAAGGHLLVSRASPLLAAGIGLIVHALWMLLWSVILAAMMRPRYGARAAIPSVAVALVAFGAAVVLPAMLLGPVATLTIGERALVHVVLALSLLIGIRIAPGGDGPAMRRVSTSDGAPSPDWR